MIIPKIIVYISIFIWLLPPLRQFRGPFFIYFLIQALSDPLAQTLIYIQVPAINFLVLVAGGLFFSLFDKEYRRRYRLGITAILLSVFFLSFLLEPDLIRILISIIHLAIFFRLLKITVIYAEMNSRIRYFHIFLMLYEMTVILKFVNRAFDLDRGITYFYFTTGFEILLGMLFILIKANDDRYTLRLPTYKAD